MFVVASNMKILKTFDKGSEERISSSRESIQYLPIKSALGTCVRPLPRMYFRFRKEVVPSRCVALIGRKWLHNLAN
jgi:hypothetical protein